jgi:hypothetical protein
MSSPQILFALAFPEGIFLVLNSDTQRLSADEIKKRLASPTALSRASAAFLLSGADDAFYLYAEKQELFGKIAHKTIADDISDAYALVYEFNRRSTLMDARLIQGNYTANGRILSAAETAALQAQIDNQRISFYTKRDLTPEEVKGVYTLDTGEHVVALQKSYDLYVLKKNDSAEKLDATCTLISGSSRIYKRADGTQFELHFNQAIDKPLASKNPADYGITLPNTKQYQTPFGKKRQS